MITVRIDLEPPAAPAASVALALHAGYGDDPAVAHEIVAVAMHSDDAWARLVDATGEIWAVRRDWVRGWRSEAV